MLNCDRTPEAKAAEAAPAAPAPAAAQLFELKKKWSFFFPTRSQHPPLPPLFPFPSFTVIQAESAAWAWTPDRAARCSVVWPWQKVHGWCFSCGHLAACTRSMHPLWAVHASDATLTLRCDRRSDRHSPSPWHIHARTISAHRSEHVVYKLVATYMQQTATKNELRSPSLELKNIMPFKLLLENLSSVWKKEDIFTQF